MTDHNVNKLEVKSIEYYIKDRAFHASMQTSNGSRWNFDYDVNSKTRHKAWKPNLEIWSSDCADIICDPTLAAILCLPVQLSEIDLGLPTTANGVPVTTADEELTWLKACWVAAHYATDLHTDMKSTDTQRPKRRKPPSPKTIGTKLGTDGLRLFIYFYVDSNIISDSTAIMSDTLRYIQEKGLRTKLCEAYHTSSEYIQNFFIRRGFPNPIV